MLKELRVYLNNLKTNKMTAVEWLEEKIWKLDDQNYTVPQWLCEDIEQAKEMEKQQQDEFAIGFAEWCIKKRIDFFDSTEIGETYTINGNVSKYKMNELLEIYKKESNL